MSKHDESRISEAAYHLWVKEGRPEGKDLDLWLKAQAELQAAEAPAPKKRRAPAKPKAAAAPKAAAKDKPKAAAKPKAKAAAKPKAKAAKA